MLWQLFPGHCQFPNGLQASAGRLPVWGRQPFALSVQRSIITSAAEGPVPEDADTRPIYATDSDQSLLTQCPIQHRKEVEISGFFSVDMRNPRVSSSQVRNGDDSRSVLLPNHDLAPGVLQGQEPARAERSCSRNLISRLLSHENESGSFGCRNAPGGRPSSRWNERRMRSVLPKPQSSAMR